VRAMARAVGESPASLYPVLMLLCDGADAFGEERYRAGRALLGTG
jgi:hypothetical protein